MFLSLHMARWKRCVFLSLLASGNVVFARKRAKKWLFYSQYFVYIYQIKLFFRFKYMPMDFYFLLM